MGGCFLDCCKIIETVNKLCQNTPKGDNSYEVIICN